MALNTKDGYNLYIKYIDNKLEKYNERLSINTKQKEDLFKIISKLNRVYTKAGINIDNLTYSNRNKFTVNTIKRYKFSADCESVLRNYILAYINLLRFENTCINSITQYAKLRVPYKFYKYIVNELNFEFSKAILLGNTMDFGSGIGNIFIKEKKRDFTNPNACKAINWRESIKVKECLIESGQVPYDKTTAPDGIKWHVKYENDYSYWWWWEARLNTFSDSACYKFAPTKFVNDVARDTTAFLKEYDTVEKIIDSSLLGNVDKLYKILELNNAHSLNYKQP